MPLKFIIVRYHRVVGFLFVDLVVFYWDFLVVFLGFFWWFGCFSILVCFGLVFLFGFVW